MLIEQKEDHYLLYRNKMKMIECVKSNDCDFFKKCIQHEFPVNEMLIIETGDTLIHVLVKYNRIKMEIALQFFGILSTVWVKALSKHL